MGCTTLRKFGTPAVGTRTDLVRVTEPDAENLAPVAPAGGLHPFSTTQLGTPTVITSNVHRRVFRLMTAAGTGSCFTVDVDGKQYICTAKHLFDASSTRQLQINVAGEWEYLDVELVGYGSADTDICVLAAKMQLSPTWQLDPTMDGLVIGQDVYFLGYPYGISTIVVDQDEPFRLPFIKKAIVSAVIKDKRQILFLDGHNNPGFSGGPVVFKEVGRPDGNFRVAAVLSGYRSAQESITDQHGNKTPLIYNENTGIVVSVAFNHALDAIKSNPIGHPVNR